MSNTSHARRNKLLLLGAVFLIIVGSSAALLAAAYYAPEKNEVQIVPDMGHQHVSIEVSRQAYNTHPPTSGPHIADLITWGEHAETIPDMRQVHNLEVGGVIIHYNCPDGCPAIVADLRAIVDEVGPDLLILEPYEDMDHTIAVTAWARLLELDTVDHATITQFIADYRGLDHSG
jgi:hypothetical protein